MGFEISVSSFHYCVETIDLRVDLVTLLNSFTNCIRFLVCFFADCLGFTMPRKYVCFHSFRSNLYAFFFSPLTPQCRLLVWDWRGGRRVYHLVLLLILGRVHSGSFSVIGLGAFCRGSSLYSCWEFLMFNRASHFSLF